MAPLWFVRSMLVAALLIVFGQTASAKIYLGKVVTATEGKLVMRDDGDIEHTFVPQKETQISLNGETAKLEQFMPGFGVTVTTEKRGDKVVISSIEARSKDERRIIH